MSEDGSTTYTATLAGVSLAAEQTITATLTPNDGTEPVVATGTVAKENTEKTKIAAFVQLVDTVASQKVPVGTALENVILPTVLKATDNEDNTVTLNVTWICEPGYNGSVIGDYVFTAVISNEVILNENIELPKITVSVQEMVEETVEETVTLTENITVTEPIIVESGVTLTYDLNGYRLYSELQNDKESLFVVKNGGNLVLKNSGNFNYLLAKEMCGRAIYCEKGSSLSIENIGFWRYGAAGYDGYVENYLGAIYADNAKLKLSNVEFGWCISEENGGAIYANNCNTITVNTEFNYCESYGLSNKDYSGGGALYLLGDDTVAEINKCKFNGHYVDSEYDYCVGAYYHGGAIYAESGSKITISDNVIDSYCTTQGNGGAIYLRIPNIVIVNNNKIINNSCGNKGGGITIVMDEGSNVTLEENIISSN